MHISNAHRRLLTCGDLLKYLMSGGVHAQWSKQKWGNLWQSPSYSSRSLTYSQDHRAQPRFAVFCLCIWSPKPNCKIPGGRDHVLRMWLLRACPWGHKMCVQILAVPFTLRDPQRDRSNRLGACACTHAHTHTHTHTHTEADWWTY